MKNKEIDGFLQNIKNTEVDRFLQRFHAGKDVDDVFTSGCCYWFAAILQSRFNGYEPTLMYDPIMNHFGTKIYGRVYDITGDVTDGYKWEEFVTFVKDGDELEIRRIMRDCVMF